jgi:hypothetical protein
LRVKNQICTHQLVVSTEHNSFSEGFAIRRTR